MYTEHQRRLSAQCSVLMGIEDYFATDPALTSQLLDEIERRGALVVNAYMRALWEITGCTGNEEGPIVWLDEWKIIRATPEAKARAFLEAVKP